MFLPRIQLHSPLQLIENDLPLKPQTHHQQKKKKQTNKKSVDPFTPPAAPQATNAAAGSSWEADPVLIPSNLVSSADEDIAQIYRQHWPQIRTRFSHQNRLQDWYNFRLSTISPASLGELNRIFADQPTVFKFNLAFGIILRNTETGALQYHHPSANNNLVLEQRFLVASAEDLDRLYEEIRNIDLLEWVRQQRPNSKWVVDLVTNVTWFFFGKSVIIRSAVTNACLGTL